MKPAVDTHVFESKAQYDKWLSEVRSKTPQAVIGFVPTMGALHDGHATLMRNARKECDFVVVSIFVNPLQFGPNEDFDRYPRSFPGDLQICRNQGVDAIFHPVVNEIYPRNLSELTKVVPPIALIEHLCGAVRPGHFEGVATVVLKLFNIVRPDRAYFGEKDFQQLTVIRRMVEDLDLAVKIVGVPTVREKDGLAMSSRNTYLSADERALAPRIHASLTELVNDMERGDPIPSALRKQRAELERIPNLTLQYLAVCDAATLAPLTVPQKPMVVLVAAKLGNVRLIDNVIVR